LEEDRAVVSLFIPCTVDLLMPEIGMATCRLLERLGRRPIYHDGQTCCGQPLFNAGYRDEARRVARHFIEVFGDDETIVSPSGSCVSMVKHRYPELLADEPPWHGRAIELAGRIYELSQYIVDVLGITDVGAAFDGTVTYHESCHILRSLGVSEQPKRLISSVRGARCGAQQCECLLRLRRRVLDRISRDIPGPGQGQGRKLHRLRRRRAPPVRTRLPAQH